MWSSYCDVHFMRDPLSMHLTPRTLGIAQESYNDWMMNMGVFMNGARFWANMQFSISWPNFYTHSGTGGAISTLEIAIRFLNMAL